MLLAWLETLHTKSFHSDVANTKIRELATRKSFLNWKALAYMKYNSGPGVLFGMFLRGDTGELHHYFMEMLLSKF